LRSGCAPRSGEQCGACRGFTQLARIVGVDRAGVIGVSASTVQTILAEIGTDMRRFRTVKQFCSRLG